VEAGGDFGAGVVGENHNVLALTVGGEEAADAAKLKRFGGYDFGEESLGVVEKFLGLGAAIRVVEDRRIPTTQLPSVEERRPVDEGNQVLKSDVFSRFENNHAGLRGCGDVFVGKFGGVGDGFGEGEHRFGGLAIRVVGAELFVVVRELFQELGFLLGVEQRAGNIDGAGGIEDMDNAAAVVVGHFHGGVGAAGSGSADH